MSAHKRSLVLGILLLSLAAAVISFIWLASIPTPGGYSGSRLLMLFGAFALICVCAGGLIYSIPSRRYAPVADLLENIIEKHAGRAAILLLMLSSIFFLLLEFPRGELGRYIYIHQRLQPFFFFFSAVFSQIFLGLILWRRLGRLTQIPWRRLVPYVLALLLLLSGWALVAWTRLGLRPDPMNWDSLSTPVVFSQALIAWIVSVGVIYVEQSRRLAQFDQRQTSKYRGAFDRAAFMLLWGLASWVWLRQPIIPEHFLPAPQAPTFEYYPYSDAGEYDLNAQNILAGHSRDFGLMRRPLYSFFLAGLHGIFGQNYVEVTNWQIVMLAVIPGLAYLLGKRIAGRPAGICLALLLLFREQNALNLARVIETASVRLMMSDVPGLALFLCLALAFWAWMQKRCESRSLAIFAGAALGLLILLRTQALMLIPVIMLMVAVILRAQLKRVMAAGSLLMIGIGLTLLPWMWRNDQVSGQFVLEDQKNYSLFMAQTYTADPLGRDAARRPDESEASYSARLQTQVKTYILAHPGAVIKYWSTHFVRNQISALLSMPMLGAVNNFGPLFDPPSYVKSVPFWEADWAGAMPWPAPLFLFLNLIFIAGGVVSAWRRWQTLGLLPLFLHLGFSLSTVPARLSGWRFILPSDWALFLYYVIGVMALTRLFLHEFIPGVSLAQADPDEVDSPGSEANLKFVFAIAGALIIGLAMPLAELSLPARSAPVSASEAINIYRNEVTSASEKNMPSTGAIAAFLEEDHAVAAFGRIMYPRYFDATAGFSVSGWPVYRPQAYGRLSFILIAPQNENVVLRLPGPPQDFPNAAEALVIGCRDGNILEALIVIVTENDHATIQARAALEGKLGCP